MTLVQISRRLARATEALEFQAPVAAVYNPLVYARAPHEAYLRRFGEGPREVLLVGMNPGPFGMAQTGVPFGEVSMVRDWMGIEAPVRRPPREHPKRPVTGFACTRSEVSGARLWGWARARFGTAERFFARFFVANYCPIVFLEESGRNYTPDKLCASQKAPLFEACDEALRATVAALTPRLVIGVGAFAEARCRAALAEVEDAPGVATILHPSPASPAANRGWAEAAERQLLALGVAVGG
jgi:single-strand selective monofunctional uracil DNA glycosylase